MINEECSEHKSVRGKKTKQKKTKQTAYMLHRISLHCNVALYRLSESIDNVFSEEMKVSVEIQLMQFAHQYQ